MFMTLPALWRRQEETHTHTRTRADVRYVCALCGRLPDTSCPGTRPSVNSGQTLENIPDYGDPE